MGGCAGARLNRTLAAAQPEASAAPYSSTTA